MIMYSIRITVMFPFLFFEKRSGYSFFVLIFVSSVTSESNIDGDIIII